MRIGIDARSMTMPHPRGTGRNLLDAFRVIPRLRPEWEFILYHQRPVDEQSEPLDAPWQFPNVRRRQLDMPGDRLDAWFQVRLPLAAREDRLDLLHLPANAAPRWCPLPFVATVHDLAPLRVPGESSPGDTATFVRGVKRVLRRAAQIITPSAATRAELHATFDIELDDVAVIPWAADSQIVAEAAKPMPPNVRGELMHAYGLTKPFFVTFSGDTPRKNARGIIAALAAEQTRLGAAVEVLFVGCDAPETRTTLAAEAHRLGVSDACRFLRFVPLQDLVRLMRASAGLLIPSLCEGFGLPILDAFACGAPVLASNVSSLPEVAGDAAVFCDPHDPAQIAAGMLRLIDLPTATRLADLGRRRLRQFTWERTAAAMCDLYERALGLEALAASAAAVGEVSR